ncbi:uncharacterized protein B0I36DRAFT_286541 [Microdochium trichocladiopsis]|uniref:Uncharacterized protein n=1 Tax=Microdochium trichocladiopsis TaxID=1682393 RepID=A0A9P9BTG9_9PEZI|nr:uncharacterized protein B0I36DRAFT_286541 [Microdochium trichocladiopsis]KAH7035955.1 hypothetical protein B0I36DRAFT_286541 [Microdochium trichocladiopsis]
MAKRVVLLIPWDPNSPEHVEELFQQRVQCGWNSNHVEKWRTAQAEGSKCIYWVVIPEDAPDRNDLIKQHLATYPKPGIPLVDTSTSINAKPVTPSGVQFQPVGHISLDPGNPSAKDLQLDLPASGCYWITTFYISTVLQSQGLGGAAMAAAESMAALEPLCAKALALDTLKAEDQRREDIANALFGGVPKVTNQEWYSRRGYQLIKTVVNHYHRELTAILGPGHESSTVFMKRDVA